MGETGVQEELVSICRQWSADVRNMADRRGRIAYFREALPGALLRGDLFEGLFTCILDGRPYPDLRQGTLFDNELVLYRDPAGMFSLRLYIYGPEEHTGVHDHVSWGVSGSAFGGIEVLRYRREDDGSDPHHAKLALSGRFILPPGSIETTLPFDAGIHRTGNPGPGVSLQVSVYGPPSRRRLHISSFDPATGKVEPMFPPRVRKKMLAEQALREMRADR